MTSINAHYIKEQILKSTYPVALTGAGISVASSLPTLTKDYRGIPIKKIMERSFFEKNHHTFYDFYREILRWKNCSPNAAHYTLSKYNVSIITQNIDGLHQKAGSKNVLEIHGNLNFLFCESCKKYFPFHLAYDQKLPTCPECLSILKPDIVLYEEQIHHWEKAVMEFRKADLVLIVGTSLKAFPANLLPSIAAKRNVNTIIINEHSDQLLNF
ncbi:Sir2 family NAD-dependent protein deacetylase [Defluviitalea raffinosedens]|uniref:Sir2 family NAD-dependent protein deacetylase n=1 Tax=Defluviitalea raffinosedens TaxID=1450156 RepID=UPI00195B59A5|nr:Sir2 family NAD-dependent protein deacetylase [Defluviitalea raffinosedens]MBM7684899.1 NAD-dependent deacetylase [Defluviitalea raffinosedens]